MNEDNETVVVTLTFDKKNFLSLQKALGLQDKTLDTDAANEIIGTAISNYIDLLKNPAAATPVLTLVEKEQSVVFVPVVATKQQPQQSQPPHRPLKNRTKNRDVHSKHHRPRCGGD